MSAARRAALLVAAALAVAGAWWLGRLGGEAGAPLVAPGESARAGDASGPADAGATDAAWVSSTAPGTQAPPPSMPIDDAPLRDAWPALLARAEGGDRAASCRLTLSIVRCASLPLLSQSEVPPPEAIARLPERSQDVVADRTAETLEALDQDKALCAGIDDALLERFPVMLLQAARGSDDPHALWAFYDGRGFGRRHLYAAEGRRLQREHAAWAMERLVAQGEPLGLVVLPTLDRRLGRPDDPALYAAVMTLHRERSRERHGHDADRGLADPMENLSPEQRARAEGLVDDLRRRFGRERRGPERTASLLEAFQPGGPMGAGIAAYCDAPD
jgi:hypothetical protein